MTSWQDPLVIVAIAAIVCPVLVAVCGLIYRWVRRDRKTFMYEVSETSKWAKSSNAIEVRHRLTGQDIYNFSTVVIKVTNMSHQPIASADFDAPVQFIFAGADVLSAEGPAQPRIAPDGHSVILEPSAFNASETKEMTLEIADYILLSGVNGHILGKEIKLKPAIEHERLLNTVDIALLFIAIAVIALDYYALWFAHTWENTPLPFISLIIAVMGNILLAGNAITRLLVRFRNAALHKLLTPRRR